MRRIGFVLIVLGAIVWAGCGSSHMKKGDKSVEKGDYEAAVRHFENAVRKLTPDAIQESPRQLAHAYHQFGSLSPKDKLNAAIMSLSDALIKAAGWNVHRAQTAHNATEQDRARVFLERALSYHPDRQDAKTLLVTVQQAINEARTLQQKAQAQADAQQWTDALETIDRALKIDRSLAQGQDTLGRIQKGGYAWYRDLAQQALDRDARQEVREHVRKARQFSDGTEVAQYRRAVDNRDKADQAVIKAKAAFERKQYDTALKQFEQAKALYPTMPDLDTQILTTKQRICDGLIARGKDYLRNVQFYDSLRVFSQSQGILAGYGHIDQAINAVKEKITEHHLSLARDYLQRDLVGNAIVHHAICLNYQPRNATVADELQRSVKGIKAKIEYTIGFVGFQSVPEKRSIADRIEAKALQHLNHVTPPNVFVRDLSDLKPVHDVQTLSLVSLAQAGTSVDARRLQGIAALITGKLLEGSVRMVSSTKYDESTYQAGMKSVHNPAYTEAVDHLKLANSALAQAQQDLASAQQLFDVAHRLYDNDPTGANHTNLVIQTQLYNQALTRFNQKRQRVTDAQQVVNTTPRQNVVPDMRKHTYPIFTKTKSAKVICMVKMLDTDSGSILFTDQLTGEASETDTTISGDAHHNVTADPLDLSDDATTVDRALMDLTGKLNRSMELAVKRHGHRFMVLMRKAEQNGQTEQTIENAMKYLFAYPIASENRKRMLQAIEPVVADQADFVNIGQLLHQHCGILNRPAELPLQLSQQGRKLMINRGLDQTRLNLQLPCELIAVEGAPVSSTDDVRAILSSNGPGDEVSISVISKGHTQAVSVELIETK